MKRISFFLCALLLAFGLMSCGEVTAYYLEDFIPPLMDINTQYPYVQKIVVTKTETGETAEFTEWADHNKIRMMFEEMRCVRREKSAETTMGFTVSFITTNETVDLFIPAEEGQYQADYVYIGEYEFEFLANGVDTFYFDSIFAQASKE